MDNPSIVDASGKEPLDTSTKVGLTVSLQNAKVSFEARPGPTWTLCSLDGGNLVSFDTDGVTINSIHPTAFVQIAKTSSSSATLQEQSALQYSSFGGGVSVDITSSNAGTEFPSGSQEFPVNNLADAVYIANNRGFTTLFIRESMTIENATISKFTLVGSSHVNTFVTMMDSAVCDGITIKNCNIAGVLDGGTHIADCSVGDISYVNGHIHDSGLYGTVYLDGSLDAAIINCYTIDADHFPIIDGGGTGQDLAMPNFSGLASLRNFDNVDGEIGIGLLAGMIMLEDTIVNGLVVISGSGVIQDSTAEAVTVNIDGLMNRELITKSSWDTVHIDTASTHSGIAFPHGTINNKVNNLANAILIAEANDINKLHIHSDLTLTQSVAGYELEGGAGIVLNTNSQSILNCIIRRIRIVGSQVGEEFFAQECSLANITNMTGTYDKCWFITTTPLVLSASNNILFNDCRSAIPGTDSPVLDFTNGNVFLNMRAYSGGVRIVNSDNPANIATIEFVAGRFNFDNATNTEGLFAVRGVVDCGGVTNPVSSNVILSVEAALCRTEIANAVLDEVTS